MLPIDLIYCGDGNKRFADIAIGEGYKYGARLPGTTYYPLFFADQNWKNPDKDKYIDKLKEERPHMASVLEWEEEDQYEEVLSWAEEAAKFVNKVVIIPKVIGTVDRIPNKVGGKGVVLGYSVPTKYGGTEVPIKEFGNRPTHLLGGSPHAQMKYYLEMPRVISADTNYHQKCALSWGIVWHKNNKPRRRVRGTWTKLRDYLGVEVEKDVPYRCFRLSCINVMNEWKVVVQEKT